MAQVRRKSKELDHYLKHIINDVPQKIQHFLEGNDKSMTYYTGNWAEDVSDNFTEKQSEKIFKNMAKIVASGNVQFVQRKKKPIKIGTWSVYGENPPQSISYYDYIVIRKA
jgi:hypothetical protein|tara:strand:- start:2908 stop:3240 length:333 start_codon:yes stop_codon:yes gene_type:complete